MSKFLLKRQLLINDVYWYINLIVLFLLSLHVGGYSGKKVIVYSLISILIFALLNKKVIVDWTVLILALAMLTYGFIFKYYFGDMDYFIGWHIEDLIFPPVLMYLVCRQMTWQQKENRIELMIFAISIGTFCYSILNHIVYLREGFIYGRVWNDFWTHLPFYATEFSYWGIFIVGLLGYGIYCLFEKKWVEGIGISFFILIENYINIVVDNRMVLMVTVVVFAIDTLLFIYFNKRDKDKLKKCFLCVGFIIFVIIGIMVFNIGGIKDTTYIQHFLNRDGGILKNIRFQMIWEAIQMLPSHWKGGGTMYAAGGHNVHNYWLQVANDTGIFPFSFWMMFNISGLISIIRLVRNPEVTSKMKYMMVSVIGAVVSYLMMEIGGAAKSDYIIFYVMLIAILNQAVRNELDRNRNEVGMRKVRLGMKSRV